MKKNHWTDGQPLFPETLYAWELFQSLAAMDRWMVVGVRKGFLRLDTSISPKGENLRYTFIPQANPCVRVTWSRAC